LHMAAELEDDEVFRNLIENDADVLIQDNLERTVLMDVFGGQICSPNLETMVKLVLTKLNVWNTTDYLNLQDDDGRTALHHATFWASCNLVHELLFWTFSPARLSPEVTLLCTIFLQTV